ncbi:hypothetical protein E2320_010774 [Naja naja]|nr:hypothetical protein E2320_010774 [Naja naja]
MYCIGKPSLAHLRMFGSCAWVHKPNSIRGKGQKKARKLRFVGYDQVQKEQNNWNRLHAYSEVFMSMHKTSSLEGEALQSLMEERQENRSEVDIEEYRPEIKREVTEMQEQMIPRRSERSNKGIPPDQFTAGVVRVCTVQYEPHNYQEIWSLPKAEQDK